MRSLVTGLGLAIMAATTTIAQQPVFRSGVDAVRIDVSVMNGRTPVSGLTVDNFTVIDRGVPQAIDSVSLDRVPLSLTLVLDTSGSLDGDPIKDLIDAANGLIQSLRPQDAAAVMTFSEPIRQSVALTDRRELLFAGVQRITAGGATALNDAVFLALQLRPTEVGETRPAVLVFSDGRDTSSWLSADQVLAAARRAGTVIHVVELGHVMGGSAFARDLAEAGGGRAWSASSGRALRELFGKVLDEMRARYLITYYPTGVERSGWHDLKVTLKGARGDVTSRPGYFVP